MAQQFFRVSYVDNTRDHIGLESLPTGPGVAVVYSSTTLADLNQRSFLLYHTRDSLPVHVQRELSRRAQQ